jgi:hypothetical protein
MEHPAKYMTEGLSGRMFTQYFLDSPVFYYQKKVPAVLRMDFAGGLLQKNRPRC